jgi:flagellar M-ring protein FliF
MNKLLESLRGFWDRVKAMSKGKKIALGISLLAVVIAIIAYTFISSNNKYGILFNNLAAEDSKTVTDKLKADKVDMKISGNSILVPKDQIDELRLELAPQLNDGSKGYELMDTGSSFGMTDEEFKLKKLRMQQGELEKTIKSFSSIEAARVHITPATDSVFVKDKTPGKASVYLKLKSGTKISNDQVKSIVSLVSGAVDNVPKENIEVVDDKMNLLSKGLFDSNGQEADSSSVQQRQGLQAEYEKNLEKSIVELLEPVIGKDKVKAKVSATLDLDSKQKTTITYDPNKVINKQQTSKQNGSTTDNGTTSQSPVDNNATNSIAATTGAQNLSTNESQNTEYSVGSTEEKSISAPGEVKRITASVIVDGKMDATTQDAIKNIVSSAIGFNQDRGDAISVLGMSFDPTEKAEIQKQIDQMNADAANEKKMALYKTLGVAGIAAIVAIIALVLIIRKFRKKDTEEEREHILDVIVNDSLEPKDIERFDPINFEVKNEKTHMENEIKKYATDKPEQVAEIIKSWLAENERG